MLDMDKELEPYITNYKINLFDYHECDDFSIFKTENRELFEVLSCAGDKRKMGQIVTENDRYSRLPIEVAKTICDIAGIKMKLIGTVNEEGQEVVDMCKAWDDRREEGREEGICAAVKMCKDFGVSVQNAIESIAKAFEISSEIADQKVKLYW